MNNKLTNHFFVQIFIFVCCFSFAARAQEVPKWEYFNESTVGSRWVSDVVINSQDQLWLTSESFIFLDQEKNHFTWLEWPVAVDGGFKFSPDYVEIDQYDSIWLANATPFEDGTEDVVMIGYKDNAYKEFYKSSYPGFPDVRLTDFYVDPAGNKWFGFNNGDVGKINSQNQYTHYANMLIGDSKILDMTINPLTDDLVVCVGAFLYRLNNGIWATLDPITDNENDLLAVAVSSTGVIYAGGYDGLFIIDNGASTSYNTGNSSNPIAYVTDIVLTDSDEFIIGGYTQADKKNYVVDKDFNILYEGISDYNYNAGTNIFLNGNDLWVATHNDGLVHITDNNTYFFNNQTISLPFIINDKVNAAAFVGDKAYVATTRGLTIKKDTLFEGLNALYSNPPVAIPGNGEASDVIYDSTGFVYVTTYSGVAQLDIQTNEVVKIFDDASPQINSNVFRTIVCLKKGMVLAASDDQYVIINNGSIQLVVEAGTVGLPVSTSFSNAIPEFNGETLVGLWIGGLTGFFYYDFTTVTNYTSDIYDTGVSALTEGPNGKLWLGFSIYGEAIQSFDKNSTFTTFELPELTTIYIDRQDIIDLEFDINNTLWVLASYQTAPTSKRTELLEFKNEVFTIIDKQYPIGEWSYDLAISPTGEKWISTDGLAIYVDDSYVGIDPCLTVDCPEGMNCVDGECVPESDACENTSCTESQTCYGGSCYEMCSSSDCFDLGNNKVAPAGASVLLSAGDGYHIYEWSTGETTQTILASESGQYWVTAYNTLAQIYSSDSIGILINANPDGTCPDGLVSKDGYCFPPTDPCDGVNCGDGMTCYQGSCYNECSVNSCDDNTCYGGQCFEETSCENTSCTESQTCYGGSCYEMCSSSDCFDLGNNKVAPAGASVLLSAGDGYHIYEWSTGETTQTILASESGQYWVTAYNTLAQIYSSDSIGILINANPDGTCPDGLVSKDGYCFPPTDPCDGVNCGDGMTCYQGSCYNECSVNSCDDNTCYGGQCFEETSCENTSCTESQTCYGGSCYEMCSSSDCFDLGNNKVAPAGASVLLSAGDGYHIYKWSTGETTQTILASASGQYWVTAYNTLAQIYSSDSIGILINANPDGTCPDGLVSKDGYCFPPTDPCDGVNCGDGMTCYQGSCYNECSVNSCDDNTCYGGQCFEETSCEDLVCPIGFSCLDGECYQTCTESSTCPPGTTCVDNLCLPLATACDYITCPNGDRCVYGTCYPVNPLAAGILSLSGGLFGENSTGGRIAENEPINGATIYLFNEAQTEINAFVSTGKDGTYDFEKLQPGTYKVFVDYPPYKVKGDGLIVLKPNIKYTNLDIVLVGDEYELRLAYVTGLEEDFARRGIFNIYPNPSHGQIMLSTGEDIGKVSIRISDVTGKLLQQINMTLPKSEEILITDLQGEAAGLKIIRIYQKENLIHESSIILKPE